jgi:hypothetical protein
MVWYNVGVATIPSKLISTPVPTNVFEGVKLVCDLRDGLPNDTVSTTRILVVEMVMLTVEIIELSKNIKKAARVKPASNRTNLAPVTGSGLFSSEGFWAVSSTSVDGISGASMACCSENDGL